ncbi:hypothetical protein E2C01_025245 [Portunus trituberculatus]|uniref:Uncharacterized protein n=1 Tax=Portunus trituberculatus TaxID=210409 RepID=A0A5B7EEY2_PORTR|nr:hypothetical protein [Portunus trituberculatus]
MLDLESEIAETWFSVSHHVAEVSCTPDVNFSKPKRQPSGCMFKSKDVFLLLDLFNTPPKVSRSQGNQGSQSIIHARCYQGIFRKETDGATRSHTPCAYVAVLINTCLSKDGQGGGPEVQWRHQCLDLNFGVPEVQQLMWMKLL